MRYKILIIDDTEKDIQRIRNTLTIVLPGMKHSYEAAWCTNPEKCNNLYAYDIYIIDIQMHTGTFGFELAKNINAVSPNASIIFCTNYDNLVFDSWRIHALFFVRKNHLKDDLKDAFLKFESEIPEEKWITVNENHNPVRIPVFRIVYVKAYRNNLTIHMKDKTSHELYCSLKHFLSLEECADFIQISRAIAINLKYAKDLSTSTITMYRDIHLPVSRRRLSYVRECFLLRRRDDEKL